MHDLKVTNVGTDWDELDAVHGNFGNVRYFLTSLPIERALNVLSTFPNEKLQFNERLQRVINMKRVRDEIVPYLRDESEARFFNAIVAVAFGSGDEKEDAFWDFQSFELTDDSSSRCVRFWFKPGCKWYVLDGQHRFKALENYNKYVSREEIDIPIVFITIGDVGRRGYESDLSKAELETYAKMIFTKINLYAKKMDTHTKRLVDDTDIGGVFARDLMSKGVLDERD